jgi:signal transduction histidine kinase
LGALAWITLGLVRSDAREGEARARAIQEEKVRQAIWRMDSTLALFLGPESTRPYHDFETLHRTGGVSTAGESPGELWLPSPLLTGEDPLVRLRFQFAGGRLTSPCAPAPFDARRLAALSLNPRMSEAPRDLEQLRSLLNEEEIRSAMTREGTHLITRKEVRDLRKRSLPRNADAAVMSGMRMQPAYEVVMGVWTSFWAGRHLFMARQVWVGEEERIQGCWLDWSEVEEVLQSTIRGFLPGTRLKPAPAPGLRDTIPHLTSIPVAVVPGPLAQVSGTLSAPTRRALGLSWSLAVLGGLVGAAILHRALWQSERRGVFASTLAHEMRTPLTTFRMYTELLAKGMVTEDSERQTLLETMHREAGRLDRLVKNVLAFARMEARRGLAFESVVLGDCLDRILPRLIERAQAAAMRLRVQVTEDARMAQVQTDPIALEQILMNLVDNGCKYASQGDDRQIDLEVSIASAQILIRIQDHGPGIHPASRRHLFTAFAVRGTAEDRAAPGVGLGLALSRRLARQLGGDLLHEPERPGASFRLELPLRKEP